MRRTKQINVTRAIALAGLFHFLCRCARACFLPFFTLYLRRLGLSAAMTGVAAGAQQLVFLLWSPVSSLLAKHYNKRRATIYGSVVSSAAIALLLLLLPPAGDRPHADACNVSTASAAPSLSSGDDLRLASTKPGTTPARTPLKVSVTMATHNISTSAPETSGVSLSNNSREEEKGNSFAERHGAATAPPVRKARSEEEEATGLDFLSSLKVMDAQQQLFFLVLLLAALWALAAAPLDWTVEDGLYEYLDFADSSDRHGSSRVWGLLGAACGVGGAGLLVSQLSCELGTRRSTAPFYLHAGLSALVLPVAMYVPLHLNRKRDRANGLLKAVQLMRASPRALLCVLTTLLVGAASSAVDDFLLWQMQDHGSGELHMGLTLAAALLSQAVFPLLAGRTSKVFAPGRLLAIGVAALALQCLYYSFLWGAWSALPAQVLSLLSGGALWWAVGVQCEDVATPGAERSVSRVYGSLSLHLGGALGSFASGVVVQRFGLAWLFRGVSAILTAWCVLLPLLQWKLPRQRRINYSRLLAADASEASESESEQERDWLDKAMGEQRVHNNHHRQ